MKEQNNIRDLVYINGNSKSRIFYSHGIEFYEFVSILNNQINNLLLLNHEFNDADFHLKTRFEYITENKLDKLLKDDIYHYGDFTWIDINDINSLDDLSPMDIAEILYFKHLAEPLKDMHLLKLENRFAYYGHDDGWSSKIYVKYVEEYFDVISNLISDKATRIIKRKIEKMDTDIRNKIVNIADEGLFIDFSKITKDREHIKIPSKIIGHYTNIDKVLDMRNKIEVYDFWLEYKESRWSIYWENNPQHL